MNVQDINKYALSFIKAKADYKEDDKQLRMLRKFLENHIEYNRLEKELTDDFEDFNLALESLKKNKYLSCIEHEYKSDGFSVRKTNLISPISYILFTCIVFNIAYDYFQSYEDETIIGKNAFYTGSISFDTKDVIKDATYVKSYNYFNNYLTTFMGNRVVKTDCTNFFETIEVSKLIYKLKQLKISVNNIDSLSYFFEIHQFSTLPQIPFSTSASFLSQIYMHEVDIVLKKYLQDEKIDFVRYVDDLYLSIPPSCSENNITSIQDTINGLYTKLDIKISASKTAILSIEQFKSSIKSTVVPESMLHIYANSEIIDETASEFVKSKKIIDFVMDLNKSHSISGTNSDEYIEIKKKYNIDDDFSKIMLNLQIYTLYTTLTRLDLENILRSSAWIMFNPTILLPVYIKLLRYYESKYTKTKNYVKKLLNSIYTDENVNMRKLICAYTYLSLNKSINSDLLDHLGNYNLQYKEFIQEHMMEA